MFNVDVISSPSASLYRDTPMWDADMAALRMHDENLVKPALLFADSVTLRSDREDMVAYVSGRGVAMWAMPMRRIMTYLQLSAEPDPEILSVVGISSSQLADKNEAMTVLASARTHAKDQLFDSFWRNHESRADEVASAFLELLRRRRSDLISEELEHAEKAGLLQRSGWLSGIGGQLGPMDLFDIGNTREDEFFDLGFAAVVEHVSTSRGAVVLEPGAESMLSSFVGPRIHDQRATERAALPSVLATSFLSRLPGLDDLSIDELLQVRTSLADGLVPFRAAVGDMAEQVAESTQESARDLTAELDRRWHLEVRPLLSELDRQVRRGSYPRQLLNAFTDSAGAQVSSGSAVVLATGSLFAGLTALAPAAAAASVPFLKALNDTMRRRDEVRDNRLFFLYGVSEQLQRVSTGRR